MRALEFFVAQVSNVSSLLYRRLPACGLWNPLARGSSRTVADWKSATQQVRKPALPGRVLGTGEGTVPGRSNFGIAKGLKFPAAALFERCCARGRAHSARAILAPEDGPVPGTGDANRGRAQVAQVS